MDVYRYRYVSWTTKHTTIYHVANTGTADVLSAYHRTSAYHRASVPPRVSWRRCWPEVLTPVGAEHAPSTKLGSRAVYFQRNTRTHQCSRRRGQTACPIVELQTTGSIRRWIVQTGCVQRATSGSTGWPGPGDWSARRAWVWWGADVGSCSGAHEPRMHRR